MIALNFNGPLFDGTARSTALFQLSAKFLQVVVIQWDARDHGHPLAFSALGLTRDPHNAVGLRHGLLLGAPAIVDRLPAFGTHAT